MVQSRANRHLSLAAIRFAPPARPTATAALPRKLPLGAVKTSSENDLSARPLVVLWRLTALAPVERDGRDYVELPLRDVERVQRGLVLMGEQGKDVHLRLPALHVALPVGLRVPRERRSAVEGDGP